MGGAGRETTGGILHGQNGACPRVFLWILASWAILASIRAETLFAAGPLCGRSGADDRWRCAGGVRADADGAARRSAAGGAWLRAAIPDLCHMAGRNFQERRDVAGGPVFRFGRDREFVDSVAGGRGCVANAFAAFWIHVADRLGAFDDSIRTSRVSKYSQGANRRRVNWAT